MATSKARSRNSGARGARGAGPTPGKARASATGTTAARAQAAAPQTDASDTSDTPSAPSAPTTAAKPVVTATPTSPAKPSAPAAQTRPVKPARPAAPRAVATEAVEEPARASGPPLWLQLTSLVLALLGLAVSAYETYAHYNGNHLAGCATTKGGTFDCSAVITSPQSMVFGVFPVAVLGLAFYVFVVAIMTPWAWRWHRREVGLLRLAAMISGMVFVMYLIYAELYQIQQVCEYCSGVHIITFLLFCITVFVAAAWGLGKPIRKPKRAR